jgi:hypothetical protein
MSPSKFPRKGEVAPTATRNSCQRSPLDTCKIAEYQIEPHLACSLCGYGKGWGRARVPRFWDEGSQSDDLL